MNSLGEGAYLRSQVDERKLERITKNPSYDLLMIDEPRSRTKEKLGHGFERQGSVLMFRVKKERKGNEISEKNEGELHIFQSVHNFGSLLPKLGTDFGTLLPKLESESPAFSLCSIAHSSAEIVCRFRHSYAEILHAQT